MQKLKNKNQGFTIIEVVLVLAIAGLIFLIVFLALPRLQRNRRDTQRKGDVGTMVSQLEQFAGNNGGTYPTAGCAGGANDFADFQATNYVNGLRDPSLAAAYTCVTAAPAAAGEVWYQTGVVCPGSGATATAGNFTVSTWLESGGTYCQGNN